MGFFGKDTPPRPKVMEQPQQQQRHGQYPIQQQQQTVPGPGQGHIQQPIPQAAVNRLGPGSASQASSKAISDFVIYHTWTVKQNNRDSFLDQVLDPFYRVIADMPELVHAEVMSSELNPQIIRVAMKWRCSLNFNNNLDQLPFWKKYLKFGPKFATMNQGNDEFVNIQKYPVLTQLESDRQILSQS